MTVSTRYLLCAAALCLAAPPAIDAQGNDRVTVAFSDPSRIGLVRVELLSGGITIKGSDRKDVLVIARQRGATGGRTAGSDRGDASSGLRRLTQLGGFTVEEERNVMTIETSTFNRTLDFEILVPARTNLKLETVNDGSITVDNVAGDLEVANTNGSIVMTAVAGSIVANTVNGRVQATMTRVTAQKSMAFTTLNGHVDVTLPASTRATFKLRSDTGDVFTDFDLQVVQGPPPRVRDNRRDGGGRYEIAANKAIQGNVNGGGPEIEMRTFNGNVYVRKGS